MSLERLLGSWDITMHHSAMTEPVRGRQHYERVLDGAYVRLDWTYDHPDFPDALALLSEEEMHYFDVRGVTRVFDVELSESGWSMVRLDPGFSQRYTALFRGADAMEANGDRSEDGGRTWQPDFTMTWVRAVSP